MNYDESLSGDTDKEQRKDRKPRSYALLTYLLVMVAMTLNILNTSVSGVIRSLTVVVFVVAAILLLGSLFMGQETSS